MLTKTRLLLKQQDGQDAMINQTITHSPCFCSGCSQAAVANIVAPKGGSVFIKLLKIHHLLYLEANKM